MGRVVATAGSGSGRIGEGSRKPVDNRDRIKQKKRKKDLEKLHRNVLEAKKNLRRKASRDRTWNTAFAKVLTNFADKRQQNDETTHALGRKGRKTNPRTICNRLLPEPILGIFRNGAKGREARRVGGNVDETHVARLEGNVLKLLNGDETNPDSSGNPGEKRAKKREHARSKKTVESNGTSGSSRLVTDSPILAKTKGEKWTNREIEKNVAGRKELAKPREQLPPQRDNTCKRRLFEPDDENESDENSFGIIDRSKIMDEICFAPARRIAVDDSAPDVQLKKYLILEEDTARDKSEGKLDWRRLTKKFWDWSPYTCYERLCAKVCSENFEKDERCIGPDPMAKVQKALGEFYARSSRWNETNIAEMSKRCKPADATRPQHSPLDNPSSNSTFVEIEACTGDLELNQDTPDSSTIKVGSWHPNNFRRISTENDATPFQDTNKSKKGRVEKLKDVDAQRKVKRDEPQRNKKSCLYEENSSNDGVVRTIDSVSLFLKKFRDNIPLNCPKDKRSFADGVAAVAQSSREKEKSNNYPDEPRDSNGGPNVKGVPRRNTKHVPSILRRPNSRSRHVENNDDKHQDTRRRCEKIVDSYRDTQSRAYTRHGTGSSSSPIAKVNGSDIVGTPSGASDTVGIDRENVVKSKFNYARAKSIPVGKNIVRHLSSDESTDVESFEGSSPTRLVPAGRCAVQAKKPRTRVARSGGGGKRMITFDIDEQPPRYQTSKPSDQRPDRLPVTSNYDSLLDYHDNPRLEASRSFSRLENDIRIATQRHVQLPAGASEIDQLMVNRNSEIYSQPIFREENRSSNRAANESEYIRGAALEQRVRKPVVLFKPIQTTGDNRQSYRSRYEPGDNGVATMSDAVRNLNVHTHQQDPRDPSFAKQRQSCPGHQIFYLGHQRQRYPEEQLTRPLCNSQIIAMNNSEIRGEIFDTQPAKFLALQQGDGGDPQRIPIYSNADRPRVAVAPVSVNHQPDSSGIAVFDKADTGEMLYVKCPDAENPMEQLRGRQQQQLLQHHRHYYHQIDPACTYRSSTRDPATDSYEKMFSRLIPRGTVDGCTVRTLGIGQQNQHRNPRVAAELPLVLPCPSPHTQQQTSNVAATAAPTLISASNNVPRNVLDMANCDQIAPTQLEYKSRSSIDANFNGGFRDKESLCKRVLLADGTIGTFLPESLSIDTVRAFGNGQQGLLQIPRRTAQLPLVAACPSPHSKLQTSNDVAATAPTSLGSTRNDVTRNVCDISDWERLASTRLKYKPRYGVDASFTGGLHENEGLPNRVRLADGTTGIFVRENRSIGKTVFFNNNDRPILDPIITDGTGYNEDRYISGRRRMCSSSVCYNAPGAYPDRVTCAGRNPDSFAAL